MTAHAVGPRVAIPPALVTALRRASLTTAMTGSADSALARAFGSLPPWIGLSVVAQMSPEALLGLVGLAIMFRPTLGAALAQLARYTPFGTEMVLAMGGRETTVRMIAAESVARQRVECGAAFVASLGRRFTSPTVRPSRVGFAFPRADAIERYQATFECPLFFDQTVSQVTFETKDARLPLVSACPELADAFGRHAEEVRVVGPQQAADVAVRAVLRSRLFGETPQLREIARLLRLTETQVPYRLAKCGTTFSALLEEARRERTRLLLRYRPQYSNEELANLLGFTAARSFEFWFKSVAGMTPREARRRQRQEPESDLFTPMRRARGHPNST